MSCPRNHDGWSNGACRTRQAGPSERWSRRGKFIVPDRRDVLVTPGEPEWIVERETTDLTGRSLRKADATNTSLRAISPEPPAVVANCPFG